jgi:hypothetical protein
MTKKARSASAQVAMPTDAQPAGDANGPFDGGNLWIGKHSADQDILVFDPAESDADGAFLSFYSLTQYRRRTFPRAVVKEKIAPLDDEVGAARAEKDYHRRATLEAEAGARMETADTERAQQQKDSVIAAHRRHLEAHGIEYQGVTDTSTGGRKGRRTKCHACGIALDDFVGTSCGVCLGVLCSCGACGCGSPVRAR